MGATLSGPALAVRTCARRLAPLGACEPRSAVGDGGPERELSLLFREHVELGPPAPVECDVSWHGPARLAPERPGGEASIQALAGLMEVNGRDAGRPRRIGLEVVSVAAGVLAAQGVVAAHIGRARGRSVARVQTSALQAGLMLLSHYVAAATAGGEQVPTAPGPAPGPPFRTSDDRWFEIEVFDPDAWKRFWVRLGAAGADLGRAWTSFRGRYYRGDCSFPPGLHEATGRHTLAEAAAAAEGCGVSLCPVRDYFEVRAEPGWSDGHPAMASGGSGVRNGPEPAPFGTPEAAGGDGDLPLTGLRVVEATNRMQGPLAGLLLRMLGAEVVKVEPPGGDVGRMVPPYAGDTGSFFACFNRGKASVEIDLTQPSGRSDLLALLEGADVFLHNWRPGRAAAWGLDAADVAPHHPRLVHATASGWGELPHNDRLIGTDFLVQAYTGAGYGLNPPGEPPRTTRVLLTDFMGALVTCEGILAGLYRREHDGFASPVGTSLLQGALALQAHVFEGLATGREHRRRQGRPVWGPLDLPIETSDGLLAVSAADEGHWRRLAEVCEVDAGPGPDEAAERLVAERLVAERLATGSAHAWEKLLGEAGVPSAVVRTDLSVLAAEPALTGLFEPLAGTALAPRSPWHPNG